MLFAPTAQHVSSLTTGNQHRAQSLLSVRCGDHDKSKIQSNIGNHEQNRLQATQQFKAKNTSGSSINVLHRLKSELLTYLECRSGIEQQHAVEHEVNLPAQYYKAEIDRNELFNSMDGIKVQVDAINLTSSGGKNMDLLKSPVFTLECRLSNELIDQVPRYEMFNIMQFECDKFQISNQCARFDQSCVRKVSLPMFLDKETTCVSNLGFLHFTVWWRESGSCLNELLGMGTLHLIEFYKHSTLKQYKRILISRYGQCLAYLYVKISILIDIQKLESTINFRYNSLLKAQRIRKAAEENETSKSTTAHQIRENVGADTTNANTDKYIINSDLQKSDYSSPMSTENSRSASKVRLLKGFVHVNVMRQQSTVVENTNMEYYLKCRCFWQDDAVIKVGLPEESYLTNFHFFEQFAVINDENFLNRVERQYLELEIWHGNPECSQAADNIKKSEFLGVVRLSLHQFFIAYRDEVITNHLCKGKLPVTSVDGWVPLESAITQRNDKMLEVKCLLAVGSEEQIMNLRQTRGLIANELNQTNAFVAKYTPNSSSQCANTVNSATSSQRKAKKKSKHENKPSNNNNNSSAIKNDNTNYFTIEMHIRDGMQFPLQVLAKKGKKKNSKDANKLNVQVEPSTYVSFQPLSVLSSNMRTYKSQDGYVFATKVAEKTTQPQWQEKFKAQIEIDYLHNKLFLLKVWQKAISAKCSTTHSIHPTPMQDEIIGYVTLNLQAFLFGKNVDGYSQVTDLNGCQVGLLNISCRPVETLAELQRRVQMKFCGDGTSLMQAKPAATVETAEEIDTFERLIPADIEHLDLGQALRRKMCELEVISTRLRSRLTLVTGGHAKNTKMNLSFPSETDDEIERIEAEMAEFEHDINTEFIEET